MRNVLRAVIAFGSLAACGGHHHGYYEAPPPLEYRHYHRLDCNQLVQCRYFGCAHHFTPHRRHDRYWHVHRTARGHYQRCYVVRKQHDY